MQDVKKPPQGAVVGAEEIANPVWLRMAEQSSRMPRWQKKWLFYTCVMYADDTEILRVLGLPQWLRYRRIAFVWLTNWLPFAFRDRLGLR